MGSHGSPTTLTTRRVDAVKVRGSRGGLVVGIAAALVFAVPIAANAGGLDSVTANPANAWVLAPDAAVVGGELAGTTSGMVLSAAERLTFQAAQSAGITTRAATATGLNAGTTIAGGSKVGAIVNTVAAAVGLGFIFGQNETLPSTPGAGAHGSDTCGWMTGTFTSTCYGSDYINLAWPGVSGYVMVVSVGPGPWSSNLGYMIDNGSRGYFQYLARSASTDIRIEVRQKSSMFTGSQADFYAQTLLAEGILPKKAGTAVNPFPTAPPTYPQSTIVNSAVCRNGAGVDTTITATTTSFQALPGSTSPTAPMVQCPTGSWLKSAHTDLVTGAAVKPLTVPYVAPDWVAEQAAQFPDCAPVGAGLCQLALWRLSAPELNCNNVALGAGPLGLGHPCAQWAADPARATNYQCRFGTHVLPILNCEPFAKTFTTGQVTATPSTETPVPLPVPGSGTITSPAVPAGEEEGACWPSGFGAFNPASWVLQPVKCAMTWAFKPDAATLTALQTRIRADVERTGVPALGAAVAGPLTSVPGDNSACDGPSINFTVQDFTMPVHPFSACAEPLKTAAVMTKALFTVVIVVGGGLALLRLFGAGFGFNVALKGGGES